MQKGKVSDAIAEVCAFLALKRVVCWLDDEALVSAMYYSDISADLKITSLSIFKGDYLNVRRYLIELQDLHPDRFLAKEKVFAEGFFELSLHCRCKDCEITIQFSMYHQEKTYVCWVNPLPKQRDGRTAPIPIDFLLPIKKISINSCEIPVPNRPAEFFLKRHGHFNCSHKLVKGTYLPISIDEYMAEQRILFDKYVPEIFSKEHAVFTAQPFAQQPLPHYNEHEKERIRKLLLALEFFQHAMVSANIPYWIDAGVLMGIYLYRNGAISPWERDIDVAVPQAFFDDVFNALANSSIYSIEDRSMQNPDSQKKYMRMHIPQFTHKRIYLDIYTFQINPFTKKIHWNDPYPITLAYPKRHHSYDLKTIFPLKSAALYERRFLVPNNVYEYLTAVYGPIHATHAWDNVEMKYKPIESHQVHRDIKFIL